MHKGLPFAIACLLAAGLAGCADDSGSDGGPDGGGEDGDGAPASKPEDFQESQLVPASVEPSNQAGEDPCTNPADLCYRYPFTVPAGNGTNGTSFQMTAVLTWTVDVNDFDLYLYKGSTQSAVSGDFPPETEERIAAAVGPGDYELVVVPWAVVGETFTLSVTFA